MSRLFDEEGPVVGHVPGPVDRPADSAEQQAGGPQQPEHADDAQQASYVLHGLHVRGQCACRAREIGVEEVEDLPLHPVRFHHQAEQADQPDGQGEQGEEGVVGDGGGLVPREIIAQLPPRPADQLRHRDHHRLLPQPPKDVPQTANEGASRSGELHKGEQGSPQLCRKDNHTAIIEGRGRLTGLRRLEGPPENSAQSTARLT